LGLVVLVVSACSGQGAPASTALPEADPTTSLAPTTSVVVSTTIPPTTTIGEGSGTEPVRLDGVSLVPVEMEDGTRIAVLLPSELVPGLVEVDVFSSGAELEAPGFHGSLSYSFCTGSIQDAGSVNSRGALVAHLSDRLVVCRPDQYLTLDITASQEIATESHDSFDLVPVDIGHQYSAAAESSVGATICCDAFGPLRIGKLVITANRYTSGRITAWDYETLMPQWTTSIGDSSILLGSSDGLVVATPGQGGLVGVDARTGETRWELGFTQGDEVVGVANEPSENLWYISTDFPGEGGGPPPRLRAVDIQSGESIWMTEGRPDTLLQWVDPTVFPDLVVVMDVPRFDPDQGTTTTRHLIAFDRVTGDKVWTTDLGDPTEGFSDRLLATDPDRGILIAATPEGEVFSIDPASGHIL